MAASDLLPVFSMSQPWAFESAMRHTMRQRAWVFSAASPMSAPPQARASTASKASKGSQMGTKSEAVSYTHLVEEGGVNHQEEHVDRCRRRRCRSGRQGRAGRGRGR